MIIGMGLVAFFCILHGIRPSFLYVLLPFPVHWEPFSQHHVLETVQLLIFTYAGFWLFRKKLTPHAKIALDVDWFYRRPVKTFRRFFVDHTASAFEWTNKALMVVVRKAVDFRAKSYSPDQHRLPMQAVISLLILVFILLVLIGLISL